MIRAVYVEEQDMTISDQRRMYTSGLVFYYLIGFLIIKMEIHSLGS